MVVVVLGMHASGTSLLAGTLHAMGVFMGDSFMGPIKEVPVWEDRDFVLMNARLLAAAGGYWANPPPLSDVLRAAGTMDLSRRMKALVEWREVEHELWGFKDPRTALTVQAWHLLLADPLYVQMKRPLDDIAGSILARGPSTKDHAGWVELAHVYYARIEGFLDSVKASCFKIQFDDIVHSAKVDQVLEGLVRWLDLPVPARAVEQGLAIVKVRQ